MEMCQKIHFWYQILPKMLIFWENGKKTFFGKKILWQAKKNNFELKMLKLLEIMLRHFSKNVFFFFQTFKLGNMFENFDEKVPKKWFFCKKLWFLTFLVKIFKNIA